MKSVIAAFIIFFILTAGVAINTFSINKIITDTIDSVSELDDEKIPNYEHICSLYEKFQKSENFINITVNHEDLRDINQYFLDLKEYTKLEDPDNFKITKSRLIHSLEHLRRLSAINFDSIF